MLNNTAQRTRDSVKRFAWCFWFTRTKTNENISIRSNYMTYALDMTMNFQACEHAMLTHSFTLKHIQTRARAGFGHSMSFDNDGTLLCHL